MLFKLVSQLHIITIPLDAVDVKPAPRTAVIGRAPPAEGSAAPVIGRAPIDDGGTTDRLLPVASLAAVGGGRRPWLVCTACWNAVSVSRSYIDHRNTCVLSAIN